MENNENENQVKCPSCGAEIAENEVCPECGFDKAIAEEKPLEPLEIGTVLSERYEITQTLETQGGINCYLAFDKESEKKVLIKEAEIPEEDKETDEEDANESKENQADISSDIENQEDVDTVLETDSEVQSDAGVEHADNQPEQSDAEQESCSTEQNEVEHKVDQPEQTDVEEKSCLLRRFEGAPYYRLKLECEILEMLKYPTIVKALDVFVIDYRAYLVEEYFDGGTLREAWRREDTSQLQQIDWLIQLCQALAKVHAAGVLNNAISPDRLKVSEANRLVLTDFSSAHKLPLSLEHRQGVDFYVAPELALNPETTDVRADLYSFGVTWYELSFGRDLTDDDFESQFILKLLQNNVPPSDAESDEANMNRAEIIHPAEKIHPSINRILLKLTSYNPEFRFITNDEIAAGKQPVASLQSGLLELKRRFTENTLVVGSQTNIGLQRDANEDNLWVQDLSYSTAKGHRMLGLFIVADGMGGEEAGEVASEIVVRTISAELTPKLMALRGKTSMEHSETLLPAINDAIERANTEVYEQAEKNPQWKGMGSTVVVVAVVGMRAYVGHVGDSRLYLINKDGISQKTEDHSIVNRLVEIGAIKPEEAATHPQRDVLTKAVGVRRGVEPDTFDLPIERCDTLLLCSDGLTKHVTDEEIREIIQDAPSPQQACDQMIDRANLGGGEDNTTVVIVNVAQREG